MKDQAIERYVNAPNGSLIFCWGKGFISESIRLFQKYESLETERRLMIKRNINRKVTAPTHVETKINMSQDISAEFEGVEVVEFKRLLEKEIGLVIAEPIIENNEEREWQFEVIKYLMKYVESDAPYDIWGFLAFVYRAIDYFIPLDKLLKYDFDWAGFCSEIAVEPFYLPGGELFLNIEEDPSMISPLELFYMVNISPKMKVSVLYDPEKIIKFIEKPDNNGSVEVIDICDVS